MSASEVEQFAAQVATVQAELRELREEFREFRRYMATGGDCRWLTLEETATFIGASVETVRKWKKTPSVRKRLQLDRLLLTRLGRIGSTVLRCNQWLEQFSPLAEANRKPPRRLRS